MDKRRALEASIAENAKRLTEIAPGDEISQRVKKRILQKLGKLKKELAALGGGTASTSGAASNTVGADAEGDDDGADEVKESKEEPAQPVMSKEERKLKLRLLNKDLSDFAQKKQLTLAKKRFEQAIRKGIKVDVHSYTNLINAYVRCSDLEGAQLVVTRMKESGIQPNLITYTTLLKGYSEMGDMKEAARIYFSCMNTDSRGPNVRSLNTFLRACTRTGMVNPAVQSFHDFLQQQAKQKESKDTDGQDGGKNKKQKLNNGSAADASGNKSDEAEYQCDASTYEYLIGLLCRAGQMDAAQAVLLQFTEGSAVGATSRASAGGVSAIENTAIYIALATVFTLYGDYAGARRWAELAADALKRTETATLKDAMLKKFQASEGGSAGKSAGDEESRSVALFLKHRRTELEGQLVSVQDFLDLAVRGAGRVEGSAGGVPSTPSVERLRSVATACRTYLQCLSQVLYFGFNGQCDQDVHTLDAAVAEKFALPEAKVRGDSASIAERLVAALEDKFGMRAFSPPSLEAALAQAGTSQKQIKEVHAQLVQQVSQAREALTAKVVRSMDSKTGWIDFPALFTALPLSQGASAASVTVDRVNLSELPVKLEICSGDGEWAVAQASADWSSANPTGTVTRTPKALWVALELRCDRIQHTLAHYMLSNPGACLPAAPTSAAATSASALHNLTFLGGNAAKIIPDRIAPESISEIFINHPQPPDRVTGGGDASHGKNKGGQGEKNQGAHLLTQEFFAQLVRVLKPTGAITIVTDNQAYAKALAASISALPVQTCSAGSEGGAGGAEKYRAVLAGGVDRYRLPGDWEHSLDDSHVITSLASQSSAATTSTGVTNPFLKKAASTAPSMGAGGKPEAAAPGQLQARRDLPQGMGGTVDVWRGEPGLEAGHVTQASSYFDRMWDLGQKKRRWFIYVKKVAV
jgi:pentatricopeptide repeat protein